MHVPSNHAQVGGGTAANGAQPILLVDYKRSAVLSAYAEVRWRNVMMGFDALLPPKGDSSAHSSRSDSLASAAQPTVSHFLIEFLRHARSANHVAGRVLK